MNVSSVSNNLPSLEAARPVQAGEDMPALRQLRQAVTAANKADLYGPRSELSLSLDEATRRPILKVVDKSTREVIFQIPPENVLKVAEALQRAYPK